MVADIERLYPVEMPVAPGYNRGRAIDLFYKKHVVRGHQANQGEETFGNDFLAGNGVQARTNFASTIRPGRDIAGQQFGQGGEVPRLTGRHKGLGELALLGGRDRDAVAFLREMAFRAMKELATMLRGLLDDLGDLRERVVKHLMQKENRAFRWRKTLQEHEKGDRNGFLLLIMPFGRFIFGERSEDRLREPDPNIFFTLSLGGFQIVQAEMGDNRGEIGLWRVNGGLIRLLITQVGILNNIFGLTGVSGHAVGDGEKQGLIGLNLIHRVLPKGL